MLLRRLLLCLLLTLVSVPCQAWDSVGHRLSAAIALNFIDDDTRDQLVDILSAHPRYREDFLDQIPDLVDRDNPEAMAQWLLGQAAFWPDIARGLPEPARRRFNRPTWHYTDGAVIRDSAAFQGNIYLGIDAFAPITAMEGVTVNRETEAENVLTALDYNSWTLADPRRDDAVRAVALCWVLHLIGDIHQPLHTGSLYSRSLFSGGDRGGNGVPVAAESNLHAVWDRALRSEGLAANLPGIIEQVSAFGRPRIDGVESDWSAWMAESRQLLQSTVYDETIRAAILAAEAAGTELEPITLSPAYIERMQQISRLRLGLAGLRLAIWFENELP